MPSRSNKAKPDVFDLFPTAGGGRAAARNSTTSTATAPTATPSLREQHLAAIGGAPTNAARVLVRRPAAGCNQPVGVVHHHHHFETQDVPLESQWDGCQVSDKISQVNGHRIFVSSKSVQECKINPIKGRHLFKNCTKKGTGVQVNGSEVIDLEGDCQPTFPECAAEYLDCTFESVPSNDVKVQGIQFNGGLFRGKGDGDNKLFE